MGLALPVGYTYGIFSQTTQCAFFSPGEFHMKKQVCSPSHFGIYIKEIDLMYGVQDEMPLLLAVKR